MIRYKCSKCRLALDLKQAYAVGLTARADAHDLGA
jgi:hypothetical protein